MKAIKYRGNNLYLENAPIEKITKKVITPFYLYSLKQIKNNFNYFRNSFKKTNPLICFSVKSNPNLTILKNLKKLGSGTDVVSIGELQIALKAGIDPKKIVFSGVGKTTEELDYAITKDILLINAESENEVNEISKIAKRKKCIVKIGLRLNPNIDAKTIKKISTGGKSDKFGISFEHCLDIFKKNINNSNISIEALSVHIGSQIKEIIPFQKTLSLIDKFIQKLKENKINIKYLDLGGGMAIPYSDTEKKFNLKKYASMVYQFNKKHKFKIIFEPGRYLSANSALLVTKVIYIKSIHDRNFVILDAAMNDLMRPALYGARHEIVPVQKIKSKFNKKIEFVGPICESTDKFLTYTNYPKLNQGDFVCFTNVGAYGRSLSSNYNIRPLPAEIAVYKNSYRVIRPRQKLQDLIK
jgi:diaminopimelate decarboxylase